ncbi:MAG: hypothetical protein LBQ15_05640 [Clostridium sp.]|jgi:hypothetical protein|nr:hypothetical protein [Clostridium sp.]
MKQSMYLCGTLLMLGLVMAGCGEVKEETAEYSHSEEAAGIQGSGWGDRDLAETDTNDRKQTAESGSETMTPTSGSENTGIPGIDIDSAEQLAQRKSGAVVPATDTVMIHIQDVSNGKIFLHCENTGKERGALGEIYLMELVEGNWTKAQRKSHVISELPATVLPAEQTIQVEFDYEAFYGILDPGTYRCVIDVNGISNAYEFNIE